MPSSVIRTSAATIIASFDPSMDALVGDEVKQNPPQNVCSYLL
jgi:hypothetical protein